MTKPAVLYTCNIIHAVGITFSEIKHMSYCVGPDSASKHIHNVLATLPFKWCYVKYLLENANFSKTTTSALNILKRAQGGNVTQNMHPSLIQKTHIHIQKHTASLKHLLVKINVKHT